MLLDRLPQPGIEASDVETLDETAWGAVSDRIAKRGAVEPAVQGRIRDVAIAGE